MKKEEFLMYNCAKCFQRGCTKQDMTKTLPECPSKDAQIQEEAKALYKEPENYKIAYCAALTEAGGYCQDTRLVEIIKFMHRAGYKKIGIAFCTGLFKETQEVVNILEYNGFEVVSIICKNGAITKDFLGLTDEQSVHGSCKNESMCNPIGQALFLNEQQTDFNLMIGLCVGHDTLFMKYAKAPMTVLAVKDRVTGHNPLAAVYLAQGYYSKKFYPADPAELNPHDTEYNR